MIKLCGGALLCALALWLLRGGKADAGLTAALSLGGVVLLWLGALNLISPVAELLLEICGGSVDEEDVSLLFRGFGIACVVQFSADFCRQTGEPQLAAAVEWVGRAELLLLCLPLMRELLTLGKELLDAGG